MTTIHLNQSDEKWSDKTCTMNPSVPRIKRLCNNTNKDDEISLGFWDRFCDLFRLEKKADALAAVWDFRYTADAADNDSILLPENKENKIRALLRLKELSDKPESFITELNMTEKGPAGCTLRIDFKIKNEPVGNTEHSFTNSDTMKTRNGDNQLINNNDNNNKLIRQILESAVRNGIDLHDISLENISLAGPRLEHARLRNARLAHISLVQAVLYHADLRHADLRHADLRYADLRHADLRHADLRHADLRHADLRYADLRRADLGGVNNLHGPQLTFARMKAAMYNNVPLTHGNIGTYFPDVFPQFISWR
ncbi:TPA: hypothetical protein HNO27_24585 [Escherichia coli]|nr:hypothetical protein [Escherichia coli]HAJ7257751.1 hypothetical protein [Escherichia coli]HAJ7262570.1 hypothetical protein [Escherichia coli]HBA2641099.1 hypothetical protein [Escherichia coli]